MRKKHENKKHHTFSSYLFLSHVFDHKLPLNKLLSTRRNQSESHVQSISSVRIIPSFPFAFRSPKDPATIMASQPIPPKVPPPPEIKALWSGLMKTHWWNPSKTSHKTKVVDTFHPSPITSPHCGFGLGLSVGISNVGTWRNRLRLGSFLINMTREKVIRKRRPLTS